MAPSLVKANSMVPWDQTANGFQFIKSLTEPPAGPKKKQADSNRASLLHCISNLPN